jgi:hypothetical protein
VLRRAGLLPSRAAGLQVIRGETTGSLFFAEDHYQLHHEWRVRQAEALYPPQPLIAVVFSA